MESESDGKSRIPLMSRVKARSSLPVLKFKPKTSKPEPELTQIKQRTQLPVLDKSPDEMGDGENPAKFSSMHIGERVCVSNVKCGVLRFLGSTAFAKGLWCGVELDEPVGKNSGEVEGLKYFTCRENHGIFAPPNKVQLLGRKPKVENNDDASVLNKTVIVEPVAKSDMSDKFGNINIAGSLLNQTMCIESHFEDDEANEKISPINDVLNSTVTIESGNVLLANSKLMQPRVYSKSGYFPPLKVQGSVSGNSTQKKESPSEIDFPSVGGEIDREENVTVTLSQTFKCSPNVDVKSTETVQNGTFTRPRSKKFLMENCLSDELSDAVECDFEKDGKIGKKLDLPIEKFVNNESFVIEEKADISSEQDYFENKDDLPDDGLMAEALDLVKCLKDDFKTNRPKNSWESAEENEREEVDSVFDFDESLGILTPNQMKDLNTLEANLLKTPSVEDVFELHDEVADEVVPEEVIEILEAKSKNCEDPVLPAVEIARQDSFLTSTPSEDKKAADRPSLTEIAAVKTPYIDRDISYFQLKDFQKTPITALPARYFEATNLSSISSQDSQRKSTSFSSPFNRDIILKSKASLSSSSFPFDCSPLNQELKKSIEDNNSVGEEKISKLTPIVGVNSVAEKLSEGLILQSLKEVSLTSSLVYHHTPQVEVKEQVILNNLDRCAQFIEDQIAAEMLLQKMGHNAYEMLEKKDRPMSSLTMSVTSIDTGYQGDAECDVQSGAASAINTPVEEHKKSFGAEEKEVHLGGAGEGDIHCILRHPRNDVGSDSDFCSDMGTSWTESEVEGDEKIRGRAARVIDGTLYYNDVDSEEKTVRVEKSHICDIVVDSMGKEPLPSLVLDVAKKESVKDSDSSTLEDSQSHTVVERDVIEEGGLDKPSTSVGVDGNEGKSEVVNVNRVSSSSFVIAPVSPPDVTINGDANTTVTIQSNVNGVGKSKKCSTPKKESESPVKKYKSPKKKVMSKIKAMIDATTCKSNKEVGGGDGPEEQSPPKKLVRTPRINRWDAVMSKIAAGQAEEKAKGKAKREVKSKVNTNLTGALKCARTSDEADTPRSCHEKLEKSASVGGPSRLMKRDSTLSSELITEIGSEDGEYHVHQLNSSNRSSRSDLSGKTTSRSKLPRMSVTERPLSPSQLSDISTMSVTSHLSSISQASRTSSRGVQKIPMKKSRKGPVGNGATQRKDTSSNSQNERARSSLSATVLKNNKKNAANISSTNKVPPTSLGKIRYKRGKKCPLTDVVVCNLFD